MRFASGVGRWLVSLAALLLLPAAGAQTVLKLAAAADLEPVLPPILKQFQAQTGIRVVGTYQASAMLTAQMMNGAPPIGGKLTDLFGWRAMFVFATVIAVLILVGAAAIIPGTHVRSARSMKTGMIAGYRLLFRKLRFVGLMLQPGLMSGAFFTQATAASFLDAQDSAEARAAAGSS